MPKRSIAEKTTSTLIGELITTHQRIWKMHDEIADGDETQGAALLKMNERRVALMRAIDERFDEGDVTTPQKKYGTK